MRLRASLMIGLVGIALAAVAGPALMGCQKKKPRPFNCERYQLRMERCENYVLEAIKRRFDVEVKTGKRQAEEATAERKVLQHRIHKRIRYKNSRRLCEKLQRLRAPRHRRHFSTMKYCYQRRGCEGFAVCMLRMW